jgi:prophage antirepressor-like protein
MDERYEEYEAYDKYDGLEEELDPEYFEPAERQVIPFYFQKAEVRTVIMNDEPWFVAKDVCDVLGIKNVTETLRNFRQKDVFALSSTEGKSLGFSHASAGINLINEPGVYRLIFKSRKPAALAFQDWVYDEVLPTLRKTGFYGIINKYVPSRPYLFKKFSWLESDLKKQLPGYNGRVKPGPHLPGIARALVFLMNDFFAATDMLAIDHHALRVKIGKCLAEENPSLEDIRYGYNLITAPKGQKQVAGKV